MEPRNALPLIQEAIRSIDKDLVVKNATTLGGLVAQSANHERYRTLLTAFFGVLATLLAAAGVFGLSARSVALRSHEMGIRRALGAQEHWLVGNTMRGILMVGLWGTAIGLSGSLLASNLLRRFLFGVPSSDPAVYGAVALLILTLCSLAGYLPSRRILRLDLREVLNAD